MISETEQHPESTVVVQDSVIVDSVQPVDVDTSLVESWILLRQAERTADSVQRASLYVRVSLAVAREQIPWVEARALERLKNYSGALAVYQRLDAPIEVYRMLAALAQDDSVAQEGVKGEVLNFIESSRSPARVRRAIVLFDSLFGPHSDSENLKIAYAAHEVGMRDRAVSAFSALDRTNNLTTEDRVTYAAALYALRQFSQAAQEYNKITSPRHLAAGARYQRARAFVAMGRTTDAMAQLRAIDDAYPADTSAASALTLLADLLSDAGRESQSRDALRLLVSRFPDSRRAATARINIALSSFVLKEYEQAKREFGALTTSADSIAAQYWLGRSEMELGDTVRAVESWQKVLQRDSMSYYGVLAARRLNTPAFRFGAAMGKFPQVPAVDSALIRIDVLRALGMHTEVRYEYNKLFNLAGSSRDRLLATAQAFAGTAEAGRAIALGRQALSRFGATPDLYRLIYPITQREYILERSLEAGIDPIVVASLIRQESHFNPGAISPVGARGLMQLMPKVAAEIARGQGIKNWNSDRLYQPQLNISLGITHLTPLIKRQQNIVRALAAYNAGESRVTLWAKKAGAADPEVFTERIPIPETRGYVKNILLNREFYRALYTW